MESITPQPVEPLDHEPVRRRRPRARVVAVTPIDRGKSALSNPDILDDRAAAAVGRAVVAALGAALADVEHRVDEKLAALRDEVEKLKDNPAPTHLSVQATCARYGIAPSTLYRELADPRSGLSAVVRRFPRFTGPYLVPIGAFEEWLGKSWQNRR